MIPIEAAILNRFGDVFGADGVAFGEVGDGAGYLQDARTC